MVVTVIILPIVVIAWAYLLWSRRKFYMCALKMRGPWGYPLVGIMPKAFKLEEFFGTLWNYTKEYKTRTYFTWLGPLPLVYTRDPKVVEVVLHSPDCLNKSMSYDAFNDAFGNGLLTSKTPKWNKHRKLLNNCFGYKVSAALIPTFNHFARELCGEMDKRAGCGEVDIKELALKMGLRSSVAITMGADTGEDLDPRVMESFENTLGLIVNRLLRPWLKSETLFSLSSSYKPFLETKAIIRNYVRGLITKKLKSVKGKNGNTNSQPSPSKSTQVFIERAVRIYQQNEFTVEEIVDEAVVLVFASFETTSNILYHTLMFLAMHPEFQKRALEEIITLFPETQFDVTFADFKGLVFLEMCINETMRLSPSVPSLGRFCEKDMRISEDITVPAGTEFFIDIFHIHRDEDIWGPTAMIYNPDRFLPNNLQDRPKCAFLPFSTGKRNCMGWQYARMFLRVMLVQILRKYKISTTVRYEDMKFEPLVSLKDAASPLLEVHRR